MREIIGSLPPPAIFERGMGTDEIPFHQNHWCLKPRSEKFFNGFLKEGDVKGRPFRVLEWSKPSWTVAYGHREVHIHPSGKRRLSIYEAMLLQGFRSDYVLKGTLSDQIRLVSDAVPPPLARAIAESVLEVLDLRAAEGEGTGTPGGRIVASLLRPVALCPFPLVLGDPPGRVWRPIGELLQRVRGLEPPARNSCPARLNDPAQVAKLAQALPPLVLIGGDVDPHARHRDAHARSLQKLPYTDVNAIVLDRGAHHGGIDRGEQVLLAVVALLADRPEIVRLSLAAPFAGIL